MDQGAFDRIARVLGGAATRRSGLRAALAGVIGLQGAGTVAAKEPGAGAGVGKGKKRKPGVEGPCGDRSRKDNICTKGSQCCTGLCDRDLGLKNRDGKGRCRCVRKGGACTEDKNCCGSRACAAGVCGGSLGPSCDAPTVCQGGCPFTTIQGAIDGAAAGDTVVIGAGPYVEDLVIAKDLTLIGCDVMEQNAASGRTVTITGDVTVTIKDIIVKGSSTPGGGIEVTGHLVLSGTTLVTNAYDSYGGGVELFAGSSLTMNDTSEISDCSTSLGGGGVMARAGSSVAMTGSSSIARCQTIFGGGVLLLDATMTMSDSATVKDSFCQDMGGGVRMGGTSALTLTGSATITANAATNGGGGVYASDNADTLTAPANSITGNLPDNCAGGTISC
ncbi:MAG: hypothetical protein ACR2J8_11275 [Thermomicrobiales bacterium]